MTSTLKANSARATIYMAFPQKQRTAKNTTPHHQTPGEGLGGLLEGIGPTPSELSLRGLLKSFIR